MLHSTNTLLSLARFPFHFWDELNPKEDPRDNPAKSIVSWIVAKSLTREFTDLPKVLGQNLAKVLEFNNNSKEEVCNLLRKRIETVNTILSNYSTDKNYWQLVSNATITTDRLKTKVNEFQIKLSNNKIQFPGSDEATSDFNLNDQIVELKLDLQNLKMMLADSKIDFEWEDQ